MRHRGNEEMTDCSFPPSFPHCLSASLPLSPPVESGVIHLKLPTIYAPCVPAGPTLSAFGRMWEGDTHFGPAISTTEYLKVHG